MTAPATGNLLDAYREAVRRAILDAGPGAEEEARRLGEAVLAAGLPMGAILPVHHQVVLDAAGTVPAAEVARRAGGFLAAFLTPFEEYVAARQHLARELHDSVIQTLIGITMNVRMLTKVWRRDPLLAEAQLRELETLSRSAVAETRTLLLEMRPAELSRTDLQLLLEQLAAAVGGRSSAEIEVTVDPLPPLPPEVHVALYTTAREALNNIARHADATSVRVRLQAQDGIFRLTVADNGLGFDPDAVPGGHFGLAVMREHAEVAGACLVVRSAPGEGTEITMTWPAPVGG